MRRMWFFTVNSDNCKTCGDLFVGHPFGDQRHQLTLATGQFVRRFATLLEFFGVTKKSLET